MSNDGWEDVSPSDDWEDVAPAKKGVIDSITGALSRTGENLEAGLENAAQMFTGMGAQIVGPFGAATRKLSGDPESYEKNLARVMDDLTYQPKRSEVSEEVSKDVGEFMNRNIVPIAPMYLGGIGGQFARSKMAIDQRRIKAAEAAKTKSTPPSRAENIIRAEVDPNVAPHTPKEIAGDVARLHDQAILDRLKEIDEGLENKRVDDYIRQKEAQQALEARQAEMEIDVKRQATLDLNAAERARQERAPVLPDHEAALASERVMPATAESLMNPADRQQRAMAREAMPRSSVDTWFADPQGQIFKGDPASELARLALERQTEAMDRELTHLRGQGLEEGQPLRPLQDVLKQDDMRAREISMIERAIEEVQGAMTAFDKETSKTKEINSRRKGGKQTGAINFGIQAAVAKAVDKLKTMLTQRKNADEVGTGIKASVIPPEQRVPKPPITAEQVAQNEAKRKLVNRNGPLRNALSEFDVIRTKEEALMLAKDAEDISSNFAGKKNLAPGLNWHASMSNNPVLKYARTLLRDARTHADNFSQTYLSNKKTGLTPVWTKMKGKERVEVIDALLAGDRHKVEVNDSMMAKLGFNEHQRQFVKTYYEANKKLWDDWVKELKELGLKVPEYRQGHFPGLFTGAYKVLVMDGKKVLGVIGADTVAQKKVAMKYVKEQMGDKVTFVEQKRRGMQGTANRFYSDLFSGTQDVLKLLAEKDPNFADVKQIIDKAVKDAGNVLFNFNVHELQKKGVFGNEGNRPWLSPERNADDAFKALVRYFEEGAMHHATQVPHKLLSDVAMAPETKHLPNTLNLLNDYVNIMMGRELSEFGSAMNTILDQPFKFLIPTVSWGKKGSHVSMGWGVGPSVPLKLSGELKNTMSQMFMGMGNYMFTAAQLLQLPQTGIPFAELVAGRLGLSQADVVSSMGRGGTQFILAFMEDQFGKNKVAPDAHMREAYQYARDRGMLTFSELERAYQGTQSTAGRVFDQAAEANMKFGEWATRTPMFMSLTDMMVKAGMKVSDALPIAENLTQMSMIDYHQWERPMVYQKLGVVGSFAAGLTTFKHGIIGQQAYLAKQGIKPTKGQPRQIVPAAASITTMLALAGITGTPFYDEIDTLVKSLTDKFGGKQQSIREIVLANTPEWIDSGLISNATNLNMQGKFSSADMVPDNLMRALSPHLEAFGRILDSAYELAKNRDEQGLRNFAREITPAGWKRATEAVVSQDETGMLIGKDGLPTRYRTPEEWKKGAITGLRSQEEAIERDKLWNDRQRYKADVDRLKEISKEYKRRVINDNLPDAAREKLIDEYMNRGGDPKELIDLEVSARKEQQFTEKERLQGIPKTLRSIHRFQNYE